MKQLANKIVFAIAVAAITIGTTYFLLKKEPKTGYVDLNKVFEKFEYKQELEKKLIKVNELRTQKLDSLEFELKVLSKQLQAAEKVDNDKAGEFQAKKEYFFTKKREFEEDNGQLVKQYDEQIIKQLSQYVNDYGKENDFNYILGADGSGLIMYANQSNDVTEDVVTYINQKYKGIK